MNGFQFQGCTRLAVKLDFIAGVVAKALRVDRRGRIPRQPGDARRDYRVAQSVLGDLRRHGDEPGAVERRRGAAERAVGLELSRVRGRCLPPLKEIVEKIIASALIYLPSSAKDFENPAIDKYLAKYVRGSNDIGYRERIKIMKLLWDAIGTEFGGRHELYEINYAGNHEDIRIQALFNARSNGAYDRMIALADHAWPTTTRRAGPAIPGSTRTMSLIRVFRARSAAE